MKILKRTEQILSLQRGSKTDFLLGIGCTMLGLPLIISFVLYRISNSVALWWELLVLPLAAWLFWIALHDFLTNNRIVTIYTFNKGLNKATIEFQGLRQSRFVEVPLHKIRAVETKFLGVQCSYGVIYINFQLQFITHLEEVFPDHTSDWCEEHNLKSIARCLQEFFN